MELYDRRTAPRRAETWYVYALVDSRKPAKKRYIGITNDPRRRLRRHINEDDGLHKVRWMKSVCGDGGDVLIAILCSGLTRDQAKFLEIELIARNRSCGARLTNMTAGGDGAIGVWDDGAFRERMSAVHRAKYSTAEARRYMGEKALIAWNDPATRANLVQSRKDMWTDELRARVSAERRGKTHSEESRANMSYALRRRFSDPVEREKLSLTHQDRYKSTDVRKMTSESKRKSAPHADNGSGFKGVSLRKDSGKYRARIDLDDGQKNLGTFLTPEEAARAYDKAALAAWGSDCYLNFPAEIAA